MEPPAKRRYTGRKAKAKGQAASSSDALPEQGFVGFVHPDTLGDNTLVQMLLQKWSWGLLHATEVQEYCLKAFKDQQALLARIGQSTDLADATLAKFAKLGNWGATKGNTHRDLLRLLGEPSVPDPLFAKVHMCIAKPAAGVSPVAEVDFPYMAPHLLVHSLFNQNRS
eukprot:3029203-Alexandrium_andersonii.AAC.1